MEVKETAVQRARQSVPGRCTRKDRAQAEESREYLTNRKRAACLVGGRQRSDQIGPPRMEKEV